MAGDLDAGMDVEAERTAPDPVATPERRWPPPALRVRPFRWYWAAQWPTLLGTWMQVVALGYLVYQQTGSTTAVAAVAAADGIPSVILSLAGGVLADRLPRRRILLVTQSLLGLSAGSLALLVATNHASFAAILVVAIVFGATDAADLPTRQALVADLVERHLVVNAVALGAAAMSATRIVGPSVAGLLIGLRRPGGVLRVSRRRVPRADRRAPDGHPRRGAAAEAGRRNRVGRADRRPARRRVAIHSSAAW